MERSNFHKQIQLLKVERIREEDFLRQYFENDLFQYLIYVMDLSVGVFDLIWILLAILDFMKSQYYPCKSFILLFKKLQNCLTKSSKCQFVLKPENRLRIKSYWYVSIRILSLKPSVSSNEKLFHIMFFLSFSWILTDSPVKRNLLKKN